MGYCVLISSCCFREACSIFFEEEKARGRLNHHSSISTFELSIFTAAYQYTNPSLSCAIRIAVVFDV